jgi:processive 1,2-diacylglycerol beta-glucosyltransferase
VKILVVHASAGAGHLKAAEAVYNYFKENYKEIDIQIIDILKTTNTPFAFNYSRGYSFLVTHVSPLWRFCFWLTSAKVLRPITKPVALLIDLLNTRTFRKKLIRENPDFVVSCHFLTSEIVSALKRKRRIRSKLITVITDFAVHPFWISAHTDIYVVASGYTKEILIKEGIKPEIIRDFGIPISSKFVKDFDKAALMDKFRMQKDEFTVLISTGSFGFGPIEEIVELLHKDLQIAVVCARNQKLYNKLKAKNYPGVFVFGFIDNIEELMFISDVIVTKPGGLSISESLSMELFPLFIAPIPGQETENIKALENYGIGMQIRDLNTIKEAILALKNNPVKLASVREKISKIKKPFAAKELSDALCAGSIWITS